MIASNKHSEIISNLPCDSHKGKLDSLQELAISTNNMLVEIGKWIMKFDNTMIDVLAKKTSPMSITPVGYIVLEKCTGKQIVDDNISFFFDELRKYPLNTPFDVERFSFDVMLRNIGNTIFNSLKNYIYYSPEEIQIDNPNNSGTINIKISLNVLLQIMSLYLRDKYINANPGFENNN